MAPPSAFASQAANARRDASSAAAATRFFSHSVAAVSTATGAAEASISFRDPSRACLCFSAFAACAFCAFFRLRSAAEAVRS